MINDNVHVSSWRGSIAHLPGKRAARLPTCLAIGAARLRTCCFDDHHRSHATSFLFQIEE